MGQFDFITDEEFRSTLESDYAELESCLKVGAWKAAHVLAGSIIEAVLVDYLIASKYEEKTGKDPLMFDLNGAIEACRTEGIISEKAAHLSHVVRHYRNLIHPGRLVRLNERVDEPGARVAKALVDLILKELAERRRALYGYTAEQIVSKIERDSTTPYIMKHLLQDLNQHEYKRLLTGVLQETYFQLLTSDSVDNSTLKAFRQCFRIAFDNAPVETKKASMKYFVGVLRESTDWVIRNYETALFRCSDLAYLDQEDAALVKSHFLSLVSTSQVTDDVIGALEGIGAYLTEDETVAFADCLIRALVSRAKQSPRAAARMCLIREAQNMDQPVREALVRRLDEWIQHLEEVDSESLEVLQDVRTAIEPPF